MTNKIHFIAKYPGPIIINGENSEETNSQLSHILTRTENNKIQRNKLKHSFRLQQLTWSVLHFGQFCFIALEALNTYNLSPHKV